jgi:signal transduction histidine kinase
MIAVVALAALALYLDARREGAAALEDFAHNQATLAHAVAATSASPTMDATEMIVSERADGTLTRADGAPIDSPPLRAAIARGDRTVKLTRPQAAALGLPERTAIAGIARRADGRAVAVVASALRVRDREFRARDRLLFGIALAALVVFGFGGIALRIQRKEHLLERELVSQRAEKRGEERLARADKLATMGAFATGIAHEIATPLGVIVARTEMLAARATGDERAERAAQSVTEQIEKIRGIVDTFLALARGEAPPHAPIAASALVDSARAMVEHRFSAAGVALDASAATNAWISGERRLLEQALVNLLLNACDASKAGQRVELTARSDREHVSFCVIDEGSGIAQDVAARATEPFFTTKPAGRGTGLGLAIVSEIAKHHQGRFTIGARKGGGTEARLELPVKAKEKAA